MIVDLRNVGSPDEAIEHGSVYECIWRRGVEK
jgi:hypothetical protein